MNWKKLGLTAASASALFLAACGTDDNAADTGDTDSEQIASGEVTLSYVAWDSEIASTYVVASVLEDIGYDVTTTQLDNAIMWEAVASGEADAMVSAWLPNTHDAQLESYGDRMDHLGVNLEGAEVGLVVPAYMDVDSIADLSDEAGQVVTGIEPGAGVVAATENALETYDNLSDWDIQTSSSGAMTTQLTQAIQNEDEIVITGWSPHWKFQSYDLKYLEDTEGIYGEAETINTFAREGLADDLPEAYHVLENFYWETDHMEEIMLAVNEGTDPKEAARNWVDENQDIVSEWTDGLTE